MLLAKVWYFLSTGGQAFVLPYFNIYFDQLGFNKEQIGTLSALRPWLSAPCAVLLCSLADRLSCHTALLVFTFAASLFLRCLLLLVPAKFLAVAALMLLSDCIGAPVGAIVDATVVGACKSDGDYGKHRMWASAAWGGLSVVAGSLMAARGLTAGFAVYLVLSVPCLYIAFRMRTDAAAEKAAKEASAATASAASAYSDAIQLKQQKQLTGPAASKGREAATAAAHVEEEAEDLMARLLQATPDSSCCDSYANSSCGGSRQCSPSPDMIRAASPFSRFSGKGFDVDSSPCAAGHQDVQLASTPAAASPVSAAPLADGMDRLQNADEERARKDDSMAAAATAGDAMLIKAWYDETQQQAASASGEQQLQRIQQQVLQNGVVLFRDGAGFAPGPADAALLDLQQQELHSALTEAAHAAGCAEAAAATSADAGIMTINTTVVGVATKQSARLEEKVSVGESQQLLQPCYSLVEWQACNSPACDPTAAEPAIDSAIENTPMNEGAPLLNLDTKQPLPTVTAADTTGAAGAAADASAAAAEVTLRSLLVRPAVLVFMWRALIIGLGLGTISNFLFLHVEELGGTGTLFGLMLCFNCITEVPAFMFQSTILEKLPVPFVFNASMLLLALRLAGYGFLPLLHCPWAVLGLELLHGVTFATSWGAGIVHCKRLAPPHLNASMQGLFSSLYGGVGSGLGALLGGVLMQELGGQALFFIVSCVMLCGWLVGYVSEKFLARPSTEQAKVSVCGGNPSPSSTATKAATQ